MRRFMLMLGISCALCACGLKGNLYLPDKSAPVIITPAASSGASSSDTSSDAAQATP